MGTEFCPSILTSLRTRLKRGGYGSKTENYIDTLEYVSAISRVVAEIIEHCKVFGGKESRAEGDLVYIGGVTLKLINEEEIRGVMEIMSGALYGFTVPDAGNLDIGYILQFS